MKGKTKRKTLTSKQQDEILARFTDALNEHGKDSQQVRNFLNKYKDRPRLHRLMKSVIIVQVMLHKGLIKFVS